MLRYPNALYKPLGAQTEPVMRGHHVVCVHTMVGYLSSTDKYFRLTNGLGYNGTESHYGVGGPWGGDGALQLDGTVWQWQDRGRQADANVDGGFTVISIETADNAPGLPQDITEWSAAQVDALVALIAWECSAAAHAECPAGWDCRDGIPAVLIPDTQPGRRGIGYHRQGIDPWRVSGGVRWSLSRGKACPGDRRIAQLTNVVIPRVQAALSGAAPVPPPVPAPLPPPPPPAPAYRAREPRTWGVIRRGMTGPKVVVVQRAAGTSADGVFGPNTERAVRNLQSRLGVAADGLFGPASCRAYVATGGNLRRGDNGVQVQFVQTVAGVGVDGGFGPITDTAVREMQTWAGLPADGIVGPNTRAKIIR